MEEATGLVWYWVSNYAIKIVIALLIFLFGKWISHKFSILLGKLLEKNRVDQMLVTFLENISYYTLLIMVLIAAAGQLGIPTTSFLTIVGRRGPCRWSGVEEFPVKFCIRRHADPVSSLYGG